MGFDDYRASERRTQGQVDRMSRNLADMNRASNKRDWDARHRNAGSDDGLTALDVVGLVIIGLILLALLANSR
ncbi:hypothetical protein [Nonomuraea recticatena]|uniref:DUF2970 domain-containing protein n=1 Tax=Nonomuraea recticatena TaxID=46178 RepID=A0ABN3S192_9ACTN